jgi:flagellar biosynthesis protein FlhF
VAAKAAPKAAPAPVAANPVVRAFAPAAVAQGSAAQRGNVPTPSPATAPARRADRSESEAGVMAELKSVRGLLEQQLAQFAWDETARRRPLRVKLLQLLLGAGFSAALARYVTERLPDDYSETQAQSWLHGALAKNIVCVPETEAITDRGGVYALVGPTGVGKTTTAAKLAARCVVKYGAQKLGLITTDHYRIGAQDQLRIYGKILGVPVHAVQDQAALASVLAGMRDKHLVLIDTVGMGQRDTRLGEQKALFARSTVRKLLLLNSTCQAETLEEVAQAYCGEGLIGAVLTKVDEAVKIGGALDIAIRHRMPLHYITTGQRVPEDLHSAYPEFLLHRALRPTPANAFALGDEEYRALAMQVGGTHASNIDVGFAR